MSIFGSTRAYLSLREIPESLGPCYLWRAPGRVLVAVNPGTSRVTVVQYIVNNCTAEEHAAYREQGGQPPVGQPLPDWMLEGTMSTVPLEYRLPSEVDAYPSEIGLTG